MKYKHYAWNYTQNIIQILQVVSMYNLSEAIYIKQTLKLLFVMISQTSFVAGRKSFSSYLNHFPTNKKKATFYLTLTKLATG
jgi:hypothetical protein